MGPALRAPSSSVNVVASAAIRLGCEHIDQTPDFYEAFQHFFHGFQKSVGRLRKKGPVAVLHLKGSALIQAGK